MDTEHWKEFEMKSKPLTKAQAIRKILADNESEMKYLMGKETRYKFKDSTQATMYLLKKKKFRQEKITYDKYHNKIIHMVMVKKK